MGLAMAVGPLVGIMAGVPDGHLVDRFGPIPVTLAGMALVTIASIGFAGMAIGASLGGLLSDKLGRRQVFALTLARAKGLDADQPRNLAKSVTVE